MFKLIRYLRRIDKREYLPKLMPTLTNRYSVRDLPDAETELILMMGIAKDPEGVRQLLDLYGVNTAAELLPLLPVPKADWRGRLYRWFIWLCGQYEHDPHAPELEESRTARHKRPLKG